jgi:hypothetical protein
MKIIDCVQGTPEWHQVKCGIPSASDFDKILTLDGKPSKQREKYLYQLAGERIVGKPETTYQNGTMQRGVEMEAEARQYYELITGQEVQQVGFCVSGNFGASPDGLVGEDGGLEIKCPILPTQVGYLLMNKLPSDYFQQVHGGLLVTGRKWWDFLSYYPGMKPLLLRITPDKDFQKILKSELDRFCKELDEITEKLKEVK